jgi:membrane associated rhomboid family serine protease
VLPLRDANPIQRTPYVTLALIVACFIGFAWELGLLASGGDAALDAFLDKWGVVPANITAALGQGRLLSQETATLITSQFLHGGWFHLLGNMLYLWIFGNNVEDRLGRVVFPLFYLAGGILAGLSQVVIAPTSTVPVIGASGAIAAVLGAYFVFFPKARVTSLVFLVFFYQLIDVPAVIVLGFWFVLQVIDGLASLGVAQTGGVAVFAHIGGFVAGAIAARVLISMSRARPVVTAPIGSATPGGLSAAPPEAAAGEPPPTPPSGVG